MNYLQLPSEIMVHLTRLSAVQLAIWADAWTWAQNGKPAYRTNEQLAEMFGITPKSVSRAITALKSYGMLHAQTANGRQRILTARIPTNVHPRQRPSPSTSIPTNVHAASPLTSMLHPHERPLTIPTNVHQEENREEKRIEKRIEKRPPPKKQEVEMPWPSKEFADTWELWKSERKAKRKKPYTAIGEQAQLHRIQTACVTEAAAIAAIKYSIAQGFDGVYPERGATKDNTTPRPAADGGHYVGNVYVPNLQNIIDNG